MPKQAAFVIDPADRLPPPPPGAPPPPRAEPYHLLSGLVEQLDQLEADLAATRRRLEILREALCRHAYDEHQPPGAQHVASVIERQLAQFLGNDRP
jgi:hypothetical protein